MYEVCDKTLEQLDELEDHPNFYIREIKSIRLKNDNVIDAWVYFLKTFKKELLQKTMYETYSNKGDHGLKYLERYLRNENYKYKDDILPKVIFEYNGRVHVQTILRNHF